MNQLEQNVRSINSHKSLVRGNGIQLVFHLPVGMKLTEEMVVEVRIIEAPITQASKQEEVIQISPPTPMPLSIVRSLPSPVMNEARVENAEVENVVIPFFSLKLKNHPAVYKIGTTFLKDIESGHKHFAFSALSHKLNDLHMLVYGSFINYSIKKPVLVIVPDFKAKSLDKFRANFTEGTLWNWKTHDWGNLCFVDYKQIQKYTEELRSSDLSLITNEFAAVLWALPPVNVQETLHNSSLYILNKINSVTFVVNAGETKNKDLKKAQAYYQCFEIPVKGILVEEDYIEKLERRKVLGIF